MVAQIPAEITTQVIYPDRDGQPMSDNTKQFRWIVTIKENLELLFAEDPQVFIAGDLLWYPVEGDNKIRQAPDAMVAFGRPKGDRGSYRQWVEDGVPPQVVFEILSPGNRMAEMNRKLHFYDRYGVEEYYIYDPDRIDLAGWIRDGDGLTAIEDANNWISPRLGIRFRMQEDTLVIYRPDDRPFMSFVEIDRLRQQAQQEIQQARQETQQARQQAEKLAAKLRELGIDPNDL
ncbi:Uma2 family endonuclease [Chamaesiphon sp.]|uniref:Uma2 family endonuclease n=1 Tax=Chamaesiphon sp. TaxID=2814140 RepID=UPI00359454F4